MTSIDKTVLVVDDEPDVRQYLSAILADAGFTVLNAADGESALEIIRSRKPDFISLDLMMPKKSGHKLLYELKRDRSLATIPVLIVTAVTGDGGDPEPFKKFISTRKQVPAPEGFFSKPIDREEFLAAVSKILGA